MSEPYAELSSITSALDDLTNRIASMAENLNSQGDDVLSQELFEVERALNSGRRQLARIAYR